MTDEQKGKGVIALSELQFVFIDDKPDERVLFAKDVSRAQFVNHVISFSSVAEAVAKLDGEQTHVTRPVFFLDWIIPGEDGRANVIRLHEAFPNAAIMVVAAHPPLHDVQDLPVSACVAKPLRLNDIIMLVASRPKMLLKIFERNGE